MLIKQQQNIMVIVAYYKSLNLTGSEDNKCKLL